MDFGVLQNGKQQRMQYFSRLSNMQRRSHPRNGQSADADLDLGI